MSITDMHRLFRTIGQQMGLQQVRGILPESIDDYINVAINEKCRSVLLQNASAQFKEKISVQNNNVSPINALSTLYYSNKKSKDNPPVYGDDGCVEIILDSLNGSNVFEFISFFATFIDGSTWHRPCRIIEFDKLHFVIDDYCSKPDNEYPIVSLYTNPNSTPPGNFVAKIYMKDYSKFDGIVFNYIKHPAIVNSVSNPVVNCDLPDYLHVEIVELAVQKFLQSVGSTTKQVQ